MVIDILINTHITIQTTIENTVLPDVAYNNSAING